MKIHNIRLGFANNSSSSHSIVFLKGGDIGEVESSDTSSFGWEPFTLISPERKRFYLNEIVKSSLREDLGPVYSKMVADQLTGVVSDNDGYGIDHQSEWVLPHAWSGVGIDLEFFEDYKNHILQGNVAILGGNDNDGDHPDNHLPDSPANRLYTETSNKGMVARKDGKYWTIFSREGGAKIRLSFQDEATPHKAEKPELVDLKITDHCPYGCAYCYQGSTMDGKHAPKANIFRILRMLATWRVFEVAIGGGEPTLHPDFLDILTYANSLGVVPNFTTKNIAWLNGPRAREILSKIGSFAYSVESASDVAKLYEAMEPHTGSEDDSMYGKATVQFIIGLEATGDTLASVVAEAKARKFPLTLLGFKNTHRGATFGEKKNDNWIKILRDVIDGTQRIAIDTVLADKYYDTLTTEYGVPKYCLTRKDGAFSAYIDAVENTMFPSSYELEASAPLVVSSEQSWLKDDQRDLDVSANAKTFLSW